MFRAAWHQAICMHRMDCLPLDGMNDFTSKTAITIRSKIDCYQLTFLKFQLTCPCDRGKLKKFSGTEFGTRKNWLHLLSTWLETQSTTLFVDNCLRRNRGDIWTILLCWIFGTSLLLSEYSRPLVCNSMLLKNVWMFAFFVDFSVLLYSKRTMNSQYKKDTQKICFTTLTTSLQPNWNIMGQRKKQL